MTNAPTYGVILTDAPDTRAKTVIGEGLATYNGGHSGIDDRQDLAVLVKNPRRNPRRNTRSDFPRPSMYRPRFSPRGIAPSASRVARRG